MQLKTILNFVEPYKSFVYTKARWADSETKTEIEILIEPRATGRAICSGCGKRAFGYDRLAERRFEFVPLWQIAVYFVYAMRASIVGGVACESNVFPGATARTT